MSLDLSRRSRLLLWLVLAALLLRFAAALPATYPGPRNDFPAYYLAGKAVAEGRPERIYATEVKGFMNLPVVAVLCVPLSFLSPGAAWTLWWWLSLLAFAATLVVLLGAAPGAAGRGERLVVAVLFLAFGPALLRCLQLGQTTPFLGLALAFALRLARAGRPVAAGLLLGAVGLIKIPPLLWIGPALLRRRWALALSAAAVVVLGVLLSWLCFGAALLGQYADVVLLDNLGRAYAAFNNQSLTGTCMRLFTDKGLTDWKTVPQPAAVSAAVGTSLVLIAGALLWRGRRWLLPRRPPDPVAGLPFELALGACLFLLVFPIVWIHYALFLAVPLALVPGAFARLGIRPGRAALAVLAVGVALAAGGVVEENRYYGARDGGWFRVVQCGRTAGVLVLLGLALRFLPEVAERESQ